MDNKILLFVTLMGQDVKELQKPPMQTLTMNNHLLEKIYEKLQVPIEKLSD